MKRKYTILIPHYKTGKMTAYCIHQILKHSNRKLTIIVIDNSQGEGLEYIEPYKKDIKIITYPSSIMQSHGLAFDYAIENGHVRTKYFITLESDSFPVQDNWLEYYDRLAADNIDLAGSKFKLSGGEYIHPAGALYLTHNWKAAHAAILNTYVLINYYPNLAMKNGFPHHYMTTELLKDFEPKHHSYNNVSFDDQLQSYIPIAESVFHNGMGGKNEDILTYGQRTIESECSTLLTPLDKINRIGYEPGQWFCYWHYNQQKKVHHIPTEIKWMPNRENQQQEYTLTENGVKHLWGVTAYNGTKADELNDIINRKQTIMDELWQSIKT
jgi:hypothetical protein